LKYGTEAVSWTVDLGDCGSGGGDGGERMWPTIQTVYVLGRSTDKDAGIQRQIYNMFLYRQFLTRQQKHNDMNLIELLRVYTIQMTGVEEAVVQ